MSGPVRPAVLSVPVLLPDPTSPTSFDHHPGLTGREPEALELAEQLRRLIRLSVTTTAPAEVTARLTAQLAAVGDELEANVPEVPVPRFLPPTPDDPPRDVPLGGAMPYDVIVGRFNPIALPVVLDFEPPKALGRAVFGVTYEGAPGCVHGAILAATFDIILTAANAIAGATGPTVRLALHYKRPTLTDEEAVFEGWVTEVTDRRVYSKGRIVQGGIVTVEADGEFAVFNHDGVQSHGQLETAVVRRTAPRETLHGGWGTSPCGSRCSRRVTRPTIRSSIGCGRASPRPTPWVSSTMRPICPISKRPGSSSSGRSAIPTTQVRADSAEGGREFPVLEVWVQYRSALSFDDEVDVSLIVGAVTRTTFQIAYLLSVGRPATRHRGDGPRLRRPVGATRAPPGMGA